MTEFVRIAVLVVGAIPLVVYPFIVIASLMGLGSNSHIHIPLFNRIMNQFFLWGTLIYPLVFFGCYRLSDKINEYSILVAFFPLAFLILLWGSFHFMDAPANTKVEK